MSIFNLTFLFSSPIKSFLDIVSYVVPIFSGITIWISFATYRAAKKSAAAAEMSAKAGSRSALAAEQSAQLSNTAVDLTKEQTEYMKNDALNKYMPKLLPSTQKLYISSRILNSPGDTEHKINDPNHNIQITNVTQGNAYMVSSWLEISQEDLLENFYNEHSPKNYNEMNRYSYNLIFKSNEDPTRSKLITDYYDRSFNFSSIPNPAFAKNDQIESIVKSGEKCEVYIPEYVTQVIMHILYSALGNKNYLQHQKESLIKLVIQYKTGHQLDSDNFMTRKYLLSFSDVKCSINNLKGTIVFETLLNFKFLEDKLN